jgi:hypothetical protein
MTKRETQQDARKVRRIIGLQWEYSRNRHRHTAVDDKTYDELFYIQDDRPMGQYHRYVHGYTLHTSAGAWIQHAKHVDVLKRAALREANAALTGGGNAVPSNGVVGGSQCKTP